MKLRFLFPLFLSFLLLVPLAHAEKGVGIMWSTQSELAEEGKTKCIEYKVYNPFSEDASIYMTATGELASLVKDSSAVLVAAGTTHDMGIPVQLCFDIPKQTCGETEVTYAGEVVAAEKSTTESGAEAAGSATRAMASAPLTLKVTCPQSEINWMLILAVAIVIVLVAAFVMMRKKK